MWPQSNKKEIHNEMFNRHRRVVMEFGWDKEVPRELENACSIYVFIFTDFPFQINSLPFSCSKTWAVLYNQPLTQHLQLYCIVDKCVVIASYHRRRKLSLALFPKVMLMHMNAGSHTDFLRFRKWAQVHFCTTNALSSSLYWLRNERKFNSRDHRGPSNWPWQQTPMC